MENRLTKATATAAVRDGMAVAPATKDPSLAKRRGVLRAAAGFMIPSITGIPVIASGLISLTWAEWLLTMSTVVLAWSLMWYILVRGWDKRLRFDPHFLLVPAAASAILLCLFVYVSPEVRLVVLQGWFMVLLFGAGLFSLKEVLVLNTFMAGGYLSVIGVLAARGEPISWPFEIFTVIFPFFLFSFFCGTVLERLRRERVEKKALRSQLSHLALTDGLTGLPNRRHFDEYVQRHSALCRRSGATYAVGLIDLDNLKEINDSLGHVVGDRVLVELAEIVRSHLRQSDLAARWGGDEFAVLLTETNAAAAGVALSEIVREVASRSFSANGLGPGQVTVSIGVTESQGEEALRDLLRWADEGLYTAKGAGGNRVDVYTPPRPPPAQTDEDVALG